MAFEEHLLRKNYEEARNYALLCLNAYRKDKVYLAHVYCGLPSNLESIFSAVLGYQRMPTKSQP